MSLKPKRIDPPLWMYPDIDPAWVKEIIDEFGIHPIIAHVLAARQFNDLEEIRHFLYAKLPSLYDPELMPDMDVAAERVLHALHNQEPILVYGDNDVDGITGTALLTEFFSFLGIPTFPYISQRGSKAHSQMSDAFAYAAEQHCKLVVTVDCGITHVEDIREAADRNLDIIVTDHHEPTDRVPLCIATLNPKLRGSTYPNRELTGVGVAFKLAHAVSNQLVDKGVLGSGALDLKRYLDLVALGTLADMGSLIGENRILVRYGLRQLRKTKRAGLAKLCQLLGIRLADITSLEVVSKISPIINSSGRIGDPNKSVELLLSRDPYAAEALAEELTTQNRERIRIERTDSEDVNHQLMIHPELLKDKALVLCSSKWHPGIIPIITARLAKQYNRPVLMISTFLGEGYGKGSLRTIPEFPLLPTLKKCGDLLSSFGGHSYAAGLTVEEQLIPQLREAFIQLVNQTLQDRDIRPKLYLDAKITFSDITFDFMESLNLLKPSGIDNPDPTFYAQVKQIWPPKIVGKSHLKLYIEQGGRVLEGIGFGLAPRRMELLKKNLSLQVAFNLQSNHFSNRASIQLLIRDFQVQP